MTTDARNPHNCDWSVNHTGTFICRLAALPCALYREKECELDVQDRVAESLAKTMCVRGES